MDKIHLYIIGTDVVKKHLDEILPLLPNSRRERALGYIYEKDKLLSIGGSYLLKKYVGDKELRENSEGKPYIDGGPFFNISHSGDYTVLATHQTREVGVDIELIDQSKVRAIRYTLNEEEKKETNVETIFKMWSNKESLVKCISTGLSDIKNVQCTPLNGVRKVSDIDYYSWCDIYKGYSLSVTLKDKAPFKVIIQEVK